MAGSGLNREESVGSQCRDLEVSVHTTHTGRSQSRSGSHVSHEATIRSMQLEIDRLRRRLCQEQRRGIPSSSNHSSDDDSATSIGQGPLLADLQVTFYPEN